MTPIVFFSLHVQWKPTQVSDAVEGDLLFHVLSVAVVGELTNQERKQKSPIPLHLGVVLKLTMTLSTCC